MVSHSSIQPPQGPVYTGSRGVSSLAHRSVAAFLALLLVFTLVRLAGALTGTSLAENSPAETGRASLEEQVVDIARLQSGQLFGTRAPGNSSTALVTTPRANGSQAASGSMLNLRLEGVVVGTPPATGFAMITSNNQPGTYRIGERLPVGNRVVLEEIHPDRVLIENNGRLETLWLYDPGNSGKAAGAGEVRTPETNAAGQGNPVATMRSYDPVAMVKEYRDKFSNNALSADFLTLAEIVRISPEYNNTQLVGYRLSPGEHTREFVRLGFKTNDIVTRVNGIELNDISKLPELFELMASAGRATVSLQREGQPLELELALDTLSRDN